MQRLFTGLLVCLKENMAPIATAGSLRYSMCALYNLTFVTLTIHAQRVQAGGTGSTGQERVLDICPEKVHQRVPLFVGSPKEVAYLESFIKK